MIIPLILVLCSRKLYKLILYYQFFTLNFINTPQTYIISFVQITYIIHIIILKLILIMFFSIMTFIQISYVKKVPYLIQHYTHKTYTYIYIYKYNFNQVVSKHHTYLTLIWYDERIDILVFFLVRNEIQLLHVQN